MYHSHAHESADIFAGLMGPIIVTRKGMSGPTGRPKDVDREFVQLYMIVDENQSPYLDYNSRTYLPTGTPASMDDFAEGNLKHSINGFIYGNLPQPTMHLNERVRWYMLALGNEADIHTPHWHGNTVIENGHREDVISLFPAIFKQVDMIPDDGGIWLYHCHVSDHMMAGMMAQYTVLP